MAQIVLGSFMVRYPLGGMMSWVLQYLIGFQQLGHQVYFVEKSGWPNSCFDPSRNIMTDDCAYGAAAVHALLSRFGLGDRWCYVDAAGVYYGIPKPEIEAILKTADLFVDMGTHGAWLDDAERTGLRVLVDGEPGFTQMKMAKRQAAGEVGAHGRAPLPPAYDRYFSTGYNIGTAQSSAPPAGIRWGHLFHPVAVDLFDCPPRSPAAPFTTVMNWQSYEPVAYGEKVFGHKDVEFARFMRLPRLTDSPLEVAVSGKNTPVELLRENGWQVRDAHAVTASFDEFLAYICRSAGEFSVCKSGYVALNTGWFSDRSAAYLASSRPVVLQDTGFSQHLPCGQGLFAVHTVEEAAAAIDVISTDPGRHGVWAREIAAEYLATPVVLSRFLAELGL